jgi:hypothetical protein
MEAARWLGERFIKMDDRLWCSVQEVGWYAVMAQALGAAIENGVMQESDLWGTDENVMDRMRAARHPDVQRWLDLVRPDVRFVRDDARPDLVVLPKVRAVDPPALEDGRVQPLSDLDTDFARPKASYLASKQGKWGLRIESPR